MTPNLLVVAGLDPSAGAGLLADARVAAAHDVRIVGVVSAETVQDTRGVRAVHPADPTRLEAQLRALVDDVRVDGVKIGMLGNLDVVRVVARCLPSGLPVVWDPVLRPSRGQAALFDGDAAVAAELLLPRVSVVTPNLDEAERLTGARVRSVAEMVHAAGELARRGTAALVTGGHLEGPEAVDVLHDGRVTTELRAPRLPVPAEGLHGTGCVLSTAIACGVARGVPLLDAIQAARGFLRERLSAPLAPGRTARSLV